LSPKQHKETFNGAGILKDLGPHLIDQAVYLFGFPQAIYADIGRHVDTLWVDDWIDILLYYPEIRVLKSWFFLFERFHFLIHGKDLS
jgi:predicted dehydrogenase